MESRVIALRTLLVLAFLALAGRLWQLQVLEGSYYRMTAEGNRLRRVTQLAPRGMIFDREKQGLASSQIYWSVAVMPEQLSPPLQRALAESLAPLLRLKPSEIRAKFSQAHPRFEPVAVARNLSPEVAMRVAEHLVTLPGVEMVPSPRRYYPQDRLAAHVLGYAREISAAELAQRKGGGYRRGDLIGKAGLEREYEAHLRGVDGGQQVEVDALGRPARVIGEVAPRPGKDLVLSIRRTVQEAAERALEGHRGAAVALDSNSGEVLALASSPSLDPNWFCGRLTPEHWRALSSSDHPQQNRAIMGAYEPGSTFKIVTAAAALEAGAARRTSWFFCPGRIKVADRIIHCNHRHGSIGLLTGIAGSCNVMFVKLGRAVGPEAMRAMAQRFGLGQPTGVDLPGEHRGWVPDPKRPAHSGHWMIGDTCQMAIGQGELLVTPMQAARLVAAVANGGYLVKPHLIKGAGSKPVAMGLSRHTLEVLREGMEAVVERGTAQIIRSSETSIAGKTGTAQNPSGRPHAWFVGYAPADHPRVAVAVMVESGGYGGAVAAPMARQIIEAALHKEEKE